MSSADAPERDGVRMPDGLPVGRRDAPLGGQAVIEGVMMRAPGSWAVAVRRGDGEIEVSDEQLVPWAARHRIGRLPVVRGVVALVESMRIGFRALGISAAVKLSEREPAEPSSEDQEVDPAWGLTGVLVLALAIGLFFVLPAGVPLLLGLGSLLAFLAVETALRLAAFVGYLASINRSQELRRTLAYHGAEHKTISCHEAGDALTPERAARYSRLHPRCGTGFLLVVMVLATVVYAPVGLPAWPWLLLSRVLALPIIVGVSYEAIKWMGRHRRRRAVGALTRPGLTLQRLTTREPDRDQLEVAIAALERVLAIEAEAPDRDGAEVEVVA